MKLNYMHTITMLYSKIHRIMKTNQSEIKYKQSTIVAIATANGYAGIGVIRISGPDALNIAKQITNLKSINPRYAHYTEFFDRSREVIDSGLLIYFKAPNSFTGEDIIEIHGHGSPIAQNLIVERCLNIGCEMAEAGEFSKRAFLNGKIDLIQAESIIDLIQAESIASAKSALKSLQGKFSKHIEQINLQLINLRMFIEATLDFPEEDIEFVANAKVKQKLEVIHNDIGKLLTNTKQGVLLNNGANIVIIGRPNVGKSSLLNALANEEVAIVTSIAGTTRDIVKQKITIDGVCFNIIDTAGIRKTEDVVEKIGIERAIHATNDADICLVLFEDSKGINQDDLDIIARLPSDIKQIFVHNKIDLTNKTESVQYKEDIPHIYISAKHGNGIDLLRNIILGSVGFNQKITPDNVFSARTRHLNIMQQAVNYIDEAFLHWEELDIVAELLRYAHSKLSEITGEFSADDLLGEIFSKFCIGK
jgi:tRNA modification GTPase